jgi:hypothetical protein
LCGWWWWCCCCLAGSFDKKAAIPNDKASWLKAWDITDKKIQDELVEIVKTDDGIVGTYYKRCTFHTLVTIALLDKELPWDPYTLGGNCLSFSTVIDSPLFGHPSPFFFRCEGFVRV